MESEDTNLEDRVLELVTKGTWLRGYGKGFCHATKAESIIRGMLKQGDVSPGFLVQQINMYLKNAKKEEIRIKRVDDQISKVMSSSYSEVLDEKTISDYNHRMREKADEEFRQWRSDGIPPPSIIEEACALAKSYMDDTYRLRWIDINDPSINKRRKKELYKNTRKDIEESVWSKLYREEIKKVVENEKEKICKQIKQREYNTSISVDDWYKNAVVLNEILAKYYLGISNMDLYRKYQQRTFELFKEAHRKNNQEDYCLLYDDEGNRYLNGHFNIRMLECLRLPCLKGRYGGYVDAYEPHHESKILDIVREIEEIIRSDDDWKEDYSPEIVRKLFTQVADMFNYKSYKEHTVYPNYYDSWADKLYSKARILRLEEENEKLKKNMKDQKLK